MNRAEKALMDRLKPLLEKHGFKFKSSNLTFKKKRDFGFLYLSFPSFPMPENGGYQVIETGLGVRHDRVDDVVNKLGHIWGDDNRKGTTTVYRGLEFFPFNRDRDGRKSVRFTHVEEDAEAAYASIEAMLLNDGFAFYDQYSSVLECSHGLNDPIDAMSHPLFNRFPMRAYYGVASAAIAEPERVPDLVQSYTDFVRQNDVVDSGVYDVAKDLSATDAIVARLKAVAEMALAAGG